MATAAELPLSSRSNQEFDVLPATATAGEALRATGAKLVLTGDGRPVGVLDAASVRGLDPAMPLAGLLDTLPVTIVVDAAAEPGPALRSWAFSQAERESSVVFVDGGAVVGVWSGPALVAVLARIRWRVNQDMSIPGVPGIAAIVRACKHTRHGVRCGTVAHFAEFPESGSPCPNTSALPAHDFEW